MENNHVVEMALAILYKLQNDEDISESDLSYVISCLEPLVLAGSTSGDRYYNTKAEEVPCSYTGPKLKVVGSLERKIEDFVSNPKRSA